MDAASAIAMMQAVLTEFGVSHHVADDCVGIGIWLDRLGGVRRTT
jgi:hypothetical protein